MPADEHGPCEVLEWDSAFFRFPVARVRGASLTPMLVREIDGWCDRNAIRCLYFLARSDDAGTTRLAEDNGFRLVDIRVTLRSTPSAAPAADSLGLVRHARPEDVPVLQILARECHQDTRFHYDSQFPKHLSNALYETWIRRSCEGYADAVLVAEVEGVPVGYISCHMGKSAPDGKSPPRIGLVGVSARAQGQGIGRTLVGRAMEWFQDHEAREIVVVTQGRNTAAQRLYQRCGFLTHKVELWYHKWYRAPDSAHE